MRTLLTTLIIRLMQTKKIARALVVTGTLGGVAYVLEAIYKLIF